MQTTVLTFAQVRSRCDSVYRVLHSQRHQRDQFINSYASTALRPGVRGTGDEPDQRHPYIRRPLRAHRSMHR
jgi:hypothetical protein